MNEARWYHKQPNSMRGRITDFFFSVPVRAKIVGIAIMPVLILGLALVYWIRTGLSDWLSYLLTDERVRIAMEAGSRSVLVVTFLAVGVAALLTFLLMLMLTRPLMELRQVAHRVADGDFSSRAHVWAQDEIGQVAHAVNLMIDRLVRGQQELGRTNRRLEAVNRVVTATTRERALQEVLQVSLRTTLAVSGLESGWVLLRDPADGDSPRFRLASHVGIGEEMQNALRDRRAALCQCQEDLLSGKLGQQAATHPCPRLTPHGFDPDKTTGHITIPLDSHGQQNGVINLVCPAGHQPSADELDVLTAIGNHLSEIVTNAQLHERLVEKEAVRQTLLNALVRAQEDERARLARELHDGAGQTLTSLLVRLKVLENRVQSQQLRDDVTELCQIVSGTVEQVRGISFRLRPSALAEFGLDMALRSLVQDMAEAAGIRAECRLESGKDRLPFETESTLYRIAQESLTNVIRHADASKVQVELVALPYAICLKVEDNGRGFDPDEISNEDSRRRLGLLSMQERAEMLGGSLLVRSAPGAGTSVEVRLPLAGEEQE